MRMRYLSAWLLLPVFVLLSGCTQTRSWGEFTDIWVVLDAADQELLQPVLEHTLERSTISPQMEPWFRVHFLTDLDINQYARMKNLLFVGARVGDDESLISDYVSGLLSDSMRRSVLNGESFFFARENALARPQQVAVLAGTSPEQLVEKIRVEGDQLFGLFQSYTARTMKSEMYERYEQKDLNRALYQSLQVHLRIPHDYQVVNERPEDHMIRYRRYYPDRWITVWWEDGIPRDFPQTDYLLDLRDSLGMKFYDPVYVERDDDFVNLETVSAGGHDGWRLEGLWGTHAMIGGGAYIMYAFPDREHNRINFVDGAVFAPDKDKAPFLWQLLTICETYGETSE